MQVHNWQGIRSGASQGKGCWKADPISGWEHTCWHPKRGIEDSTAAWMGRHSGKGLTSICYFGVLSSYGCSSFSRAGLRFNWLYQYMWHTKTCSIMAEMNQICLLILCIDEGI